MQIMLGGTMAWGAQVCFGLGGLGFVYGSCIGFVASSYAYFMHCRKQAFIALDRFPSLMKMHLMMNFKLGGFERLQLQSKEQLAAFRAEVMSSLRLRCWLIAAWQSAASSIEVRIKAQLRPELIDTGDRKTSGSRPCGRAGISDCLINRSLSSFLNRSRSLRSHVAPGQVPVLVL